MAKDPRADGRARRKTTTRKISLNLTGEAQEILERMADDRGLTISEVVRRALALAAFFEDQTTRGGAVLVTHDNGKTYERVHFLSH